jgi:glycosyltransferase involved in cell wall biosynthesis
MQEARVMPAPSLHREAIRTASVAPRAGVGRAGTDRMAGPLRVLHVIPSVSAGSGGPSKAIAQMEQALSALGVEITTATTDDDGKGRHLDAAARAARLPPGVTRHYFPKQTDAYKVSLPLFSWLRANVRTFDLVHVHALFSFAPVAAAWIARGAGVPYIIRPLGVLNRYGMEQRRSGPKALSMRLVENHLLRDAAAVQFTAEQERAEAELLGVPMRGRVVPLGIEPSSPADASAFAAAFPGQGGPRLLFLSRVDRKKNIEALLGAVAHCRARFPGLTLAVCGDGDAAYIAELKSLAQGLGIAGAVHWTGHVSGALKASAFAASDLFVLPSYSENFGIAAVEALCAGLPCVLGEGVAVSSRIAQAQAGLAVAPTAEAVSAAIDALLGDPDALRGAGANARALALSDYSLEAMGRGLLAMYEDVLAAAAAAREGSAP